MGTVPVPQGATFAPAAGQAVAVPQGATFAPAAQQNTPPAAGTDTPEQPGMLQRAYETSPIKPLVEMAKQQWDASRQKVSEDQAIGKQTIDLVKAGDYGRATELLLSHLAKRTGESAMSAPGVQAVKGIAENSIQHGKKAVEAAGQGNAGEAIAQGAEAIPIVGQAAEQIGEPLGKDIKEGNYGAAVGDVAGGGVTLGTALLGSPEARGAAGDAIEGAEEGVSGAAKKITAPIRKGSVQPEVQGNIREAVGNTATKSIAKTVEDSADAKYAEAKSQYQTFDKASGIDTKYIEDKLKANRIKLQQLTSSEEDMATEAKILKGQRDLEQTMNEGFERAKKAGVDPAIVDKARETFKQSQALYDLDNAVKKTTKGMRPDIGDAKSAAKNPEVTDPEKFFNRINDMHRSGRLHDALGAKNADDLLSKANEALVKYRGIARNQKIAVGSATMLGLAGMNKYVKNLIPDF